jgi:hypothetical protein
MRVKHPEGGTVSIDVPRDCMVIVAGAGELIAGTMYYRDALLTVSNVFGEYLIEQGKARRAEEVN